MQPVAFVMSSDHFTDFDPRKLSDGLSKEYKAKLSKEKVEAAQGLPESPTLRREEATLNERSHDQKESGGDCVDEKAGHCDRLANRVGEAWPGVDSAFRPTIWEGRNLVVSDRTRCSGSSESFEGSEDK